jgi:hypothetical protein
MLLLHIREKDKVERAPVGTDEATRRSNQEHANLVDHPAPFAVELRNDRKKLSTFFGSTFSQLNRNGNDRNIIGYLGTIKFGQE